MSCSPATDAVNCRRVSVLIPAVPEIAGVAVDDGDEVELEAPTRAPTVAIRAAASARVRPGTGRARAVQAQPLREAPTRAGRTRDQELDASARSAADAIVD